MRKRLTFPLLIAAGLVFATCTTRQPVEPVAVNEYMQTEAKDTVEPMLISEAPRPEGWPKLTPVDTIQVKRYPSYRAAFVEANSGQNRMFGTLFNHIKKNEIAMTAPVEMTIDESTTAKSPRAMAFMYQSQSLGETGEDGNVSIIDVPEATMLSIGVRGSYSDKNYDKAVAKLEAWLDENKQQYVADGESRYLGYNSPFVPWFMRYGEVQIPVRKID